METCLVTGGAGFIGSHVVDALLRRGSRVIALDNLVNGSRENLADALKAPTFEFVEGDILDTDLCRNLLRQVDVVFHLACLGVRHSLHSPYQNHLVNSEGTIRLLEAAREVGAPRFVYISSSEVYGKAQAFPISENVAPVPITVYGASKLAGENYTMAYAECFGMDIAILRIFNNYGPRAHYEGDSGEVIPRSIVNALHGRPPVIFGDGSVTRDFFFVEDTASLIASLLEPETAKRVRGRVLNIGTGVEVTIKRLVESICEQISSGGLQIDYAPSRPADVPRLWVDNSRMKECIAYKPIWSFEKGLQRTIAYYRELIKNKPDALESMPRTNWRRT